MPRDNFVSIAAANLARIPFRFRKVKPYTNPRKALILRPCCISQVMMATPLLKALSTANPDAQFDWAVDQWSRSAVSGNPRIHRLLDTGTVFNATSSRREIGKFISVIKDRDYDTCFVPSRSSLAAYVVWRARIPQRIGLNDSGRGFTYTIPVSIPKEIKNQAVINLELAKAIDIQDDFGQEFFPSDQARSSITQLIVDEFQWHGEVPLVIVHPGGGENPLISEPEKRWPIERVALLVNRLHQELKARIVLIASEEEKKLASDISGLISTEVVDLAGRLDLDQVGALAEVADLYVGNDAGLTHVAAAVGCKTLVVYGPTDPMLTAPYATKGQVIVVASKDRTEPFSWEHGPSVDGVVSAAIEALAKNR